MRRGNNNCRLSFKFNFPVEKFAIRFVESQVLLMSNRIDCGVNTSVFMGWFKKRHNASISFCLYWYMYNNVGANFKIKQQGLNTGIHTVVLPTLIHFNFSKEFRFVILSVADVKWKSELCKDLIAKYKNRLSLSSFTFSHYLKRQTYKKV